MATPTILLAEDEPQLRRMLVRMLEKGGYAVIEAADGAEALETAERFSGCIDVLLTDVVMPRLTGDELATKLVTSHPESKLLFMSGYTHDVDLTSRFPGCAFLRKPFTPNQLRSQVGVLCATALAATA